MLGVKTAAYCGQKTAAVDFFSISEMAQDKLSFKMNIRIVYTTS